MSSVNTPDSKDKVPSNSVNEDVKMRVDREVEALRNHLIEAYGAAVSRSLSLVILIPVKEDLVNTHLSMVQQKLSHLLGGNPEYRTATSTKAISQLRKLFRKAANEVADLEEIMFSMLDQKCDEQATGAVAEKEIGGDV